MENEIWKDIKDFEGLYQVSNKGRVKSLKRLYLSANGGQRHIEEHIVKTQYSKGYLRIHICKNGKYYSKSVHRLVAEAFISNPENKPCVDHINGKRDDNRIENLKWCTIKENNNNPIYKENNRNARVGGKNCNSKWVAKLDDNNVLLCVYDSISNALKDNNVRNGHISECCNGKYGHKTFKGYKWQYVDDYLADWWEQEMERIEF
jgi:hypothetical protein